MMERRTHRRAWIDIRNDFKSIIIVRRGPLRSRSRILTLRPQVVYGIKRRQSYGSSVDIEIMRNSMTKKKKKKIKNIIIG